MLRLANPPGAYEGAGTHSIIPHPTQTCSKHYERRAGLRELVEAAYSGSCAGILQSALAYQHVILVLKFAEAPPSPRSEPLASDVATRSPHPCLVMPFT